MNNSIKKIRFLFLSILLISLPACSFLSNKEEGVKKLPFSGGYKEIRVYFTKSKGPEEVSLVSVPRKVSNEDSTVAGAVRELFLGPTKSEELKGIMSEIPLGTRLINVEESEDEILLDFSTQFLTGGGSAAMQLRYLQIYRTIRKIAPFKDIYLQVDGKLLKTIGGEGLEVTQPLTKINDYTQKPKKRKDVQP